MTPPEVTIEPLVNTIAAMKSNSSVESQSLPDTPQRHVEYEEQDNREKGRTAAVVVGEHVRGCKVGGKVRLAHANDAGQHATDQDAAGICEVGGSLPYPTVLHGWPQLRVHGRPMRDWQHPADIKMRGHIRAPGRGQMGAVALSGRGDPLAAAG